ncbi:unnamed protein product [Rotaria sp. Silwood2]|nr:unnamed protein product [Rotaria sp. Silwood2]
MNNVETTNEFIFIIDCSGSMRDENKIGLARESMLLFLKSLPLHCHFNIIRFGSTHEALFDEITAIYNEENAQKAERLVSQLMADLGGTELLQPLEWIEQHPPQKGRARQIFLLTDGEISNVDEVLDLCRSMATSTRVFSFGLGHSPSHSLVKGLARATNGRFVFIPPNSSVDIHVGEQLQKALQSCITNVQVKWNLGSNVMSAPTKIPPVYANDRLIVYALADDPMLVFDRNSNVELCNDKSRLGEGKIVCLPNVGMNGAIARLAAKALILECQHSKLSSSIEKRKSGSLLSCFRKSRSRPTPAMTIDEKRMTKKSVIDLSLKYQILSPYTAFIGVEKRVNASNADMVLREVPIQISTDDQHLQTPHVMSLCASKMPSSGMLFHAMSERKKVRSMMIHSKKGYEDAYWSQTSIRTADSFPVNAMNESSRNALYQECFDLMASDSSCDSATTDSRQQSLVDGRINETWPTGDQNIVRYLIKKQKFDGLWDLDAEDIENLTGKSLTNFTPFNNKQILISAIVVIVLELKPLQWVEQHSPGESRARQIFLTTDGEITNVNEVLDLCRSMAISTRIFSFGLGHSPSRSLVKGLARATNGRFVFIPSNTSVDIHVGEQLQRALQSCITGIEVKWSLDTTVISAPTKIPPVYANDRLIVYALANNPMFVVDHNSSVELYNDKSRLGEAKIDCIPNVSMNGTIARLAAKALILELQHSKLPSSIKKNNSGSLQSQFQEDKPSATPSVTIDEKEVTKKSTIELSLKYQILSPHTAFIGVEKRASSI